MAYRQRGEDSLHITGKPSYTGSAQFTVQVKDCDSPGKFGDKDGYVFSTGQAIVYDVAIIEELTKESATPRILTKTLPNAILGETYEVTLAATGGTPPLRFIGGLGDYNWASLSDTGVLTGKPDRTGRAKFSAMVIDKRGRKSNMVELTMDILSGGELKVLPFKPPAVRVGEHFAFQLPVVGGNPPYTCRLAEAIKGVKIDEKSCIIRAFSKNREPSLLIFR